MTSSNSASAGAPGQRLGAGHPALGSCQSEGLLRCGVRLHSAANSCLACRNDWTYWCGVGVFHSGVEVYGVEYAFGGERAAWSAAASHVSRSW